MVDFPDPRALKILKETYWSSTGWKSKPRTPAPDLAYAKAAGIMFDPVALTHDDAVAWALRSKQAVSQEQVVSAFLASLSTRRLDLRSALGSFAAFRHFRKHKHRPFSGSDRSCAVCGEPPSTRFPEDLSVLSFERFRWGGVRHVEPVYAAFDLERLASTPPLTPVAADIEILREILAVARAVLPKGRPGSLDKAFPKSLPSSKDERRTLLSIFGYAGILQPKALPSFRTEYVSLEDRDETDDDWTFPIGSWRGSDGVNEDAVQEWFGSWLKQTR